MMSAPLTPALVRTLRAERATRISQLRRHLAMFLSKGIDPTMLLDLMLELMHLQEDHNEQ
jgi:hypothetical protein